MREIKKDVVIHDEIQNIMFYTYLEYKGDGPASGNCDGSHQGDKFSLVPNTSLVEEKCSSMLSSSSILSS
jgi:hypothetical protein